MNQGLKQFEELLKTDAEFQEKLKTAAENYTGNTDFRSIFEGFLVPIAKEYGITATYDEFQEYLEPYIKASRGEDAELSQDELAQVAGGKITNGGLGAIDCDGVGSGFGFTGGDDGAAGCIGLGGGNNHGLCASVGTSE